MERNCHCLSKVIISNSLKQLSFHCLVLLCADEHNSHTHVRCQILIQIRHVEIIFSENIYGELGIIQLGSAAKCWLLYLDLNIFIP